MTWPPVEKARKPRRRNVKREAPIQEAMVAYLDLALPPAAGIWWSATLNGVRLTPRQQGEAARAGLRKGLFDLIFVRLTGPDAGQTYHIEVKAPGGSLTPEQKVLMDALWAAGRGAVARNPSQLCAALTAWGFPIRAWA